MQTNRCNDLPPRILILDRENDIRQVLVDLLTQDGYCVDGVGCSEEALERMNQTRYSSILLNAGMLHIGEDSILQLLRDRAPETPIIVLTGYLTEEMTVGLLRKGASAYLSIPYSAYEIKAALERAVKTGLANV
jgi:DNA-binding NtrC family response regulator